MFNVIAPKLGSTISPLATEASLASVAGGIRQSRTVETASMPSLTGPKASSEWMEWALSGRLGDFLGWTGQKFAEIGSDVFPAPSIAERRGSMRANKRALLQALSVNEMLLDENAPANESLPLLKAYLRDALMLLQSGHLSSHRLKRELSQILAQAEYVQQVGVVSILSEWLANLNKRTSAEEVLISEQKIQNKRERRSGFSASIDVGSLTGTDGFTVSGTGAGTELGYSVHKLGDINGDKYDDFVVGGAPSAPLSGVLGANLAHIIFGSPTTFTALPSGLWDLSTTPLTGANGFSVKGETSSDSFGISVSSAGDINGDGYDDVLIGAPYAVNGVGPGRAYVIFGAPTATFSALGGVRDLSTTPLTGTDGFTLSGINQYDFLGFSVSGAGDINGDGYDDIIVGAPYAPYGASSGPGQAYVIFGAATATFAALPSGVRDLSTTPLTGSDGFTITGVADGDVFGSSVSGAGDIDQDGYDDVIIGAPKAPTGSTNIGEARVIFGAPTATFTGLGGAIDLSTTTLTGSNGFTVTGLSSAEEQLGFAVSGGGDINQDGFADILVGAPSLPFGTSNSGRTYVIFGAPKATFVALATLAGQPSAVLSPNHLTGPNGFTIQGINVYDQLGSSVSVAGDINGDGYDDIIVGAPSAPYGAGPGPGQAYVIYGAPMSTLLTLPNAVLDVNTLTATTGFTISMASGDKFGFAVGAAGDVNGDGVDDLIVGAPFADTTATDVGQAYVILGIASEASSSSTGLAIDVNGLKIKQGKRVPITSNELSASLAGASSDELLFTVSYGGQHGGSIHGYFEYASNQGTPIYQFTQADIEANKVNFVHDGEDYAPNYAINVCHGDASLPVPVKFHFEGHSKRDIPQMGVDEYPDDEYVAKQLLLGGVTIEDVSKSSKPEVEALKVNALSAAENKPSEQKAGAVLLAKAASSGSLAVVNNDIEIKRYGKHRVRLSELSATGGSVSDDALKFTILNNYRRHEHGYFKDISQLGEVKQFTQADIRAGNIYFIHDGTHDEPNYAVSVSDAECTIPETVVVDFYTKHGHLAYSGRPAGASELRSDAGLMPSEKEVPEENSRQSTGDARLLNQAGFFGKRESRVHRSRTMTTHPQKGAQSKESATVEAIASPRKTLAA